MDGYQRHLDETEGSGMLANPFTFREILLRGLLATGRAPQAARLLDQQPNNAAAPQWAVIEQITVGDVLLASDDRTVAECMLLSALAGAEMHRLPHQVQRAVRSAERHSIESVIQAGRAILDRLEETRPIPT